jgi:hypothetical protein
VERLPMSDRCSRRTGRSAATLYDKRTSAPAPAVAELVSWTRNMKRAAVMAVLAANIEQVFTRKSADDCALALLSTPLGGLSTEAFG